MCRPMLTVELELEVVDEAELLLVFRRIDVTVNMPLVGWLTEAAVLAVADEAGD